MNGAEAVARSFVESGLSVCFANPGTSEMHFVAALDAVQEMRGILALFEGVATGAADGYARMTGRPAAALLHLGPGLGNGLANLHNARRARVPVVSVVGDHATYHKRYDSPLESDIEAIAGNVSGWIRRSARVEDAGADAADAVTAACGPPERVATLILPADVCWSEGGVPATAPPPPRRPIVPAATVEEIAGLIRGGETSGLLLGGTSLREPGLLAAARIAAASGARLFCETFPARLERGAGLPNVDRIAYLAEIATGQLDGLRHLVLVDARPPVSFFAYPDKPSSVLPAGCEIATLAGGGEDAISALLALAEVVAAGPGAGRLQPAHRPRRPSGALTADSIAQAVGALLPEGAIVSDEANTSGLFLAGPTAGAPRHDWLSLTGGAIGQGLPVAVGAAVACPGRRVLALQADGSAMYTFQSLWTMAREGLDMTVVLLNNRSYSILVMELNRVGAGAAGPKAREMFDLARPEIDFVALARGLGVPASSATTADEFAIQLEASLSEPGPHLIEAVIPAMF